MGNIVRRFLRTSKTNIEGMLETIAWLASINEKHRFAHPLKSFRMRAGLYHLKTSLERFLTTIENELKDKEV